MTNTNQPQIVDGTAGIRHEISKGALTLDKIYKGDYQKEGTMTAQIRQVVNTKSFYPSKKVESSLQAGLFKAEDFGFEAKEFESNETRVAWVLVPVNATEPEIKAKLEAATTNGACIYRVLSNKPILDENQVYGIEQKLTTMDNFANTQAVRFPDGHPQAGQLTLDKAGNVQYRRTFFWESKMEDQDGRGKGEPYLSPELKAELAGASVMQGQTL